MALRETQRLTSSSGDNFTSHLLRGSRQLIDRTQHSFVARISLTLCRPHGPLPKTKANLN